ncbi:MAG: helix-turn-helix domain-containing protein [Vicinamibacterales bacterium]
MSRRREPPIVDPATYPRRFVTQRTAAQWLEMDEKTLRKALDDGELGYTWFGQQRRIKVADLIAFESRRTASGVPRDTGMSGCGGSCDKAERATGGAVAHE